MKKNLQKLMRKINTGKLERTFKLNRDEIDEENRTVPLAFSSEEPVERWFGIEILSHDPSHVDLGRLNDGGALLVDHDPRDHVGTIEDAIIDSDRRGRAIVRFGRSARAQDIFQDVLDGIRKHISVGYRIHEMVENRDTDTYTATLWQPHEISFVSIPADATVGVGRSEFQPGSDANCETNVIFYEDRNMKKFYDEHGNVVDKDGNIIERKAPAPAPAPAPASAPVVDVAAIEAETRQAEIERAAEIRALGVEHDLNEEAEKAVADGTKIDAFRVNVLDILKDTRPVARPAAEIGLTDNESRSFSMIRALNALANPNDKRAQEAAAFEIECSQAVALQRGVDTAGFYVPANGRNGFVNRNAKGRYVPGMAVPFEVQGVRDLSAGTATDGQELVADNLLASSFIDVLRNQSMVGSMGTRVMADLDGDVSIPRQTSGSTAQWIATEGGNSSQSDPQFDQVTMSPKTAGVYSEVTRQLLKQSSIDVETLLRLDFARGMALLIDTAALYGTGASGQPQGISTATGVNTPTAFAAAVPTFAEIVAMESAVAADNALLGSMGYMIETSMRGSFKTAEKFTGTGQTIWEPGNSLNGYNTAVTNQVTSGDVFFGNWADVLIGLWGNLDLLIDPYSNSLSGTVRVVAHQSVDVALRHGESFAFNNDGI